MAIVSKKVSMGSKSSDRCISKCRWPCSGSFSIVDRSSNGKDQGCLDCGSQFCTIDFTCGIDSKRAFFVIREHKYYPSRPVGEETIDYLLVRKDRVALAFELREKNEKLLLALERDKKAEKQLQQLAVIVEVTGLYNGFCRIS